MTIENRKKENKAAKEQPVHVKYDIHNMRKEFGNQKYEWEKINEKIKKIRESKMEIKRKTDKIWEKVEMGLRKQLIEKNPQTKKIEETLNEKEKNEIKEQEKEREKLQKRIEKDNEEKNIYRERIQKLTIIKAWRRCIEEKKEKNIVKDLYTDRLCDKETAEITKIEEINTGYIIENQEGRKYIHGARKIEDQDIKREMKQTIPNRIRAIKKNMLKYKLHKKKRRINKQKNKESKERSKRKKMVRRKRRIKKTICKRKYQKNMGLPEKNKTKR